MNSSHLVAKMKPLALLRPLPITSSASHTHFHPKPHFRSSSSFRVSCFSLQSEQINKSVEAASRSEYKAGVFDDFFLNSFRNKLAKEVGWDSEKPGYNGLIELVNGLMMKSKKNSDATDAAVRILKSFFPPLLLELYRKLIAPLSGGKVAAMMVVNSVDLPDGSSCRSGVLVERCKYLEESKCVGICINTCKLPTQTFFKDYMGVPLLMEPNFSDYSCQFKFGVNPPPPEDDSALKEPCLEICPNAVRRREGPKNIIAMQCPKA